MRRPVSQLVPVLLSVLLVGLLAACSDGTAAAPEPGSGTSTPSAGEPTSPALPRLRYVALGDSFTAAPGLAGSTLPCLRSEQNYPALAAEGLGERYRVRLEDRSCIGADSSALVGEQQLGGGRLPPQLDALDAQTDLVTLSMGGNDEQFFVRLVAGCLSRAEDDPAGSPCADADAADPLTDLLPEVRQRLVDAVAEVRRRAPRAEVLLVGYPQLVPPRGSCRDRLPLATGDWAFARDANRALDAAVAGAAEDSGARFVDVWAASRGHDVCADEPWVAGQAGDAASGAIPFHPLPEGQRAVAERLLDRVGG